MKCSNAIDLSDLRMRILTGRQKETNACHPQDVRIALRQLRKSPGFTLTVVLTLALGIGATTAVFSLIEGILLRPFPFPDPERLVCSAITSGTAVGMPVTAREIGEYSKSTSAFSSMGGFELSTYELSGGEFPEEISGARMTASVFTTLGVQPQLGRVFTPSRKTMGTNRSQ